MPGWVDHIPYFLPYAMVAVIAFFIAWKVGVPTVQKQLIETQKGLIEALEAKVKLLTEQVDLLEGKLSKALAQVDALVSVIEERKPNGRVTAIRRQRKTEA